MNKQQLEPQEAQLPAHVIAVRTVAEKIANETGYKNKMPSYPKGKGGLEPSENQVRGYKSRFFNWQSELMHKRRMQILDIEASVFSEKASHNLKQS